MSSILDNAIITRKFESPNWKYRSDVQDYDSTTIRRDCPSVSVAFFSQRPGVVLQNRNSDTTSKYSARGNAVSHRQRRWNPYITVGFCRTLSPSRRVFDRDKRIFRHFVRSLTAEKSVECRNRFIRPLHLRVKISIRAMIFITINYLRPITLFADVPNAHRRQPRFQK